MTEATVKTVQFIDRRIEPQPDPVYDYMIAPTQNQYYKINASSLSNSSVTFNNLTTLGVDRAYLDTMELEITAIIDFKFPQYNDGVGYYEARDKQLIPSPDSWTFDSFPFSKCCSEIRVNINGGSFFSQPESYIRAKERYMSQLALSESYENICPVHKPHLQYESGRTYTETVTKPEGGKFGCSADPVVDVADGANTAAIITALHAAHSDWTTLVPPTRYPRGMFSTMQSENNLSGGYNNAIIRLGKPLNGGVADSVGFGYENWFVPFLSNNETRDFTRRRVRVTWREPVMCSPFSSRYDSTFGRPLYNITSMDLQFQLDDLRNMIKIANFVDIPNSPTRLIGYDVALENISLCYQVMTIPPIITKPLTTLVPYRRFVPYITDFKNEPNAIRGDYLTFKSGQYTLNEIPTAIWVFCAPSRKFNQNNYATNFAAGGGGDANNVASLGNWECNNLFGYIKKINISMANTTQILATADIPDLYRIAKANGCEDSYWSWAGDDVPTPDLTRPLSMRVGTAAGGTAQEILLPKTRYYGAGSVLRLLPGQDLIIPDMPLIPGANGNNMVFQVNGEVYFPPHCAAINEYSLWLLFEYVGVAAISPGQCEISMNPLGSGEIMQVSPIMSSTTAETEGVLEGGRGGRDILSRMYKVLAAVGNSGIIKNIARIIDPRTADMMEGNGIASKRPRTSGSGVSGGAVIGKGLNDWV